MKMLPFIILIFCSVAYTAPEDVSQKESQDLEPMVAPIEFDKIKEVIKKDRLDGTVQKKKQKIVKKTNERRQRKIDLYNIPGEKDFWSFFSEYWLVKNVTILKWDFKKPDYGLDISFKNFLEDLGIFEVKYKILLVNTPDISHFALPSDDGEILFLLSVPFIRTLDLSKLEISILLLEDYLRVKEGYFKEFVSVKGLKEFMGGNFHNKDLNTQILKKVAEKYDDIIFDKGFNFQQQFNVTNKMNAMLKSNLKWWNGYFLLLGKIDNLVKTNILYQKYLKIYPSPELQIGWLKPQKKKVL